MSTIALPILSAVRPRASVEHRSAVRVTHQPAAPGELGVIGLEQIHGSIDQREVLRAPSHGKGRREVVTCDEEISPWSSDINGLGR